MSEIVEYVVAGKVNGASRAFVIGSGGGQERAEELARQGAPSLQVEFVAPNVKVYCPLCNDLTDWQTGMTHDCELCENRGTLELSKVPYDLLAAAEPVPTERSA